MLLQILFNTYMTMLGCGLCAGMLMLWNDRPPYNEPSLYLAAFLIFIARILCVLGTLGTVALLLSYV